MRILERIDRPYCSVFSLILPIVFLMACGDSTQDGTGTTSGTSGQGGSACAGTAGSSTSGHGGASGSEGTAARGGTSSEGGSAGTMGTAGGSGTGGAGGNGGTGGTAGTAGTSGAAAAGGTAGSGNTGGVAGASGSGGTGGTGGTGGSSGSSGTGGSGGSSGTGGSGGSGGSSAECAPVIPTGSRAVAYQIDAKHAGAQPNDTIALPLCQRWSADVGGISSYPVVADGRVFVTTTMLDGDYGATLLALDENNGQTLWGPVALGGTYYWSALAFDSGRVIAVNGDGDMRAFDAATGHLAWEQSLSTSWVFSSAPSPYDGKVYASWSGQVAAIDVGSGEKTWTSYGTSGDYTSPAVGDGVVFITDGCASATAFDSTSGQKLWSTPSSCADSAGGGTPALAAGRLYARSFYGGGSSFIAATGAFATSFVSGPIPAFSDATGLGYFVQSGVLVAIPPGELTPQWKFGTDLLSPPLVVGSNVIVASSFTLYALDATTGAQVGSAPLDGLSGPDEWNFSSPLMGLAAANGRVFVPVGSTLVCF